MSLQLAYVRIDPSYYVTCPHCEAVLLVPEEPEVDEEYKCNVCKGSSKIPDY